MRTLKRIIILGIMSVLLLSGCGGKQQEVPAGSTDSAETETETITIRTADTGDFTMNYFRFGQGEKIFVMLPGLSVQGVMGSAEQIAEAYRMLDGEFTVYVFDPRNELPDSYSVDDMAEDTAAVLQSLGIARACVFGASMGGMTALKLALRHPELTEKVVAASSALRMGEGQYQAIDRWIRLAEKGDAEALYLDFGEAVYPENVFSQSRDGLAAASASVTDADLKRFLILAESMRGFDISGELDRIECPILAVNDREDQVLGPEAAKEMEMAMRGQPDREFFLYDGYGHALYDTAPDFKELMLEFFRK